MNKFLTAITAVAIGIGTFGAGAASAQNSRTVITERHVDRHHWNQRKHKRRVCSSVWRNHHRVQRCRTVYR